MIVMDGKHALRRVLHRPCRRRKSLPPSWLRWPPRPAGGRFLAVPAVMNWNAGRGSVRFWHTFRRGEIFRETDAARLSLRLRTIRLTVAGSPDYTGLRREEPGGANAWGAWGLFQGKKDMQTKRKRAFLRQKAEAASCTRTSYACATGLRNATASAVKGNVPPGRRHIPRNASAGGLFPAGAALPGQATPRSGLCPRRSKSCTSHRSASPALWSHLSHCPAFDSTSVSCF